MVDSTQTAGTRLERYTEKRPQEVLIVNAEVDGEADQVAIFRGFSSSLVRTTASDPDQPVLPDRAIIQAIDRLHSPYDPGNPQYIQQGLTWETMQRLLEAVGI